MPKFKLEDIGTTIQSSLGLNDEQAETAKRIAGFIPIVGTGIDIYDAAKDPTAENIGWVAAGLLTDIVGGRLIAGAAKAAKAAHKANISVKTMTDVEKALKLRHAGDAAVRLAEERAINSAGRVATNAEKYWARKLAEEKIKKEWKNATRKTVIRGRAYPKRKTIAKSTSELDPYIIRAAGWAGTDALENVIQWGSQTSPNRRTLSGNY